MENLSYHTTQHRKVNPSLVDLKALFIFALVNKQEMNAKNIITVKI